MVALRTGCHANATQPEGQPSKPYPVQIRSTSSRSSLPGLKKGIFFGGTSTRAPVFGFRPMRPRLWRVWNRPNPRISTLSPDRSARMMLSNMAQTTTSDSFRDISMAWQTSSVALRLGTSWEQQASRRILGHSINRESRLQEGERLSDSPVKSANFFGYGRLGNRGRKN